MKTLTGINPRMLLVSFNFSCKALRFVLQRNTHIKKIATKNAKINDNNVFVISLLKLFIVSYWLSS
jgi:hypothetical protein